MLPLLSQIPLVRLVMPFGIGIALSRITAWQGGSFLLQISVALLVLVLLSIVLKGRKDLLWKGLATNIIILSLGFFCSFQFNNYHEQKESFDLEVDWVGEVESVTKKLNGTKSFIIEIDFIKNNSNWDRGDFIVQFLTKDTTVNLDVGQTVSARSRLSAFQKPLNPVQFDFAGFMNNRGIYYYSFEDSYSIHGSNFSLYGIASQLRVNVIKIYQSIGIQGEDLAVLIALTLGDKTRLTSELKEGYASSGAMHILAVSGLHLGIVFLLFNGLFNKLLVSKKKFYRVVKAILLLLIIWSFALLTGFSPSVQRAACMFSFLISAKALNRNSNILNSLAGSAFLLLIINPNILFEVGFQLSYSAVIGIVLIHPVIYSWVTFQNWFLDKSWSLLVVSFAATLATLPLSMFYFHQFPNWFLLTNLLIIPLAFVIVSGSVIIVSVWQIFSIDFFLGNVLNYCLKLLNGWIRLMNKLPYSKTDNVWFTDWSIVFILLTITLMISWLYIRNNKLFIGVFISVALVSLFELIDNTIQAKKQTICIYALNGSPICKIDGFDAAIYLTEPLNEFSQKVITDHLSSLGVRELTFIKLSEYDGLSGSKFYDLNQVKLISIFNKPIARIKDLALAEKLNGLDSNIVMLVDAKTNIKELPKIRYNRELLFTYDFPLWKIPENFMGNNIRHLKQYGYVEFN